MVLELIPPPFFCLFEAFILYVPGCKSTMPLPIKLVFKVENLLTATESAFNHTALDYAFQVRYFNVELFVCVYIFLNILHLVCKAS